eukprot:NODE_7895_length_1541_cov_3.623762.p11 GENE.NODE_7895_length_1541_cov_3.623762~~NODE_7895_length_1541_cov_3.623762.p11  ORF type:complete len:51 (+),score=8.66 NODE_7895_length_1541_cov_3.623762:872-1024(+)
MSLLETARDGLYHRVVDVVTHGPSELRQRRKVHLGKPRGCATGCRRQGCV